MILLIVALSFMKTEQVASSLALWFGPSCMPQLLLYQVESVLNSNSVTNKIVLIDSFSLVAPMRTKILI